MPKGQLSRVSWPGANSWILFIFQAALRVLQPPHKHSQLAIHTQPTHHNKINMFFPFFVVVFVVFVLLKSKRISKYYAATSKLQNDTLKGQ